MDKLFREDQHNEVNSGRMVRVRRGEEKPEGAHLMSDNEVLAMQIKTIMTWKNRTEMWPFTWGVGVLGGVAAASGIYINNFCRSKLGLMNLARLGTYTPTVVLPVVLATVFHKLLVTDKILVGDFQCTTCAAIRAGSIQAGAGALYPLILGPLICVTNARKYYTYHVPSIAERAQVLPFLQRIVPKGGVMLGLVLANFAIAMAITERETVLFAKYLSPTSASLESEQEDEFFQ